MRTLATISFAFGAGVFAAVLLPFTGWQLYGAAVCAVFGAYMLLRKKAFRYRRHSILIAFALAAALVYCAAYDAWVAAPIRAKCVGEGPFAGEVCDWPRETEYGAKVTLKLEGLRGKAVYYGDRSLLEVQPGDHIEGTARWQDAGRIHDNDVTTFTARGVYALLYRAGDVTVTPGGGGGLRYAPERLCRRFQETVTAVWGGGDAAAMVSGILTGDLSALSEADYTVMKETGLAHLFAVSGMNCAFLVALLGLILPPRHRRTGAAVTIVVLLFYMAMVGMTPSVVRACIMQIFLVMAPLFLRESDPPTSLGTALLIILAVNPNAAASVSLQLSFAATLGLVLFASRFYRGLAGLVRPRGRLARKAWAFLCGSLSVTGAAMLFTTPLTAYYFNNLALISPVSNLLVVPAVGLGFMLAFVTVAVGFVWLPLAQVMGVCTALLMEYALWVSRLLVKIPYHAVYFTSRAMRLWILFVYGALLGCFVIRRPRHRYAAAAVLAVLVLAFCRYTDKSAYDYGDMVLTALDVGQGASTIVHGDATALIDCGSRNSYVDAGTIAADTLHTVGVGELDAVVVTHYHADHTNGLTTIFTRLRVRQLYLPDIEDEYGVREELIDLAEQQGTEIHFVREVTHLSLGAAELTVYPPVGAGDSNEQGLSICAASGEFEALITGDMSSTTERALVKRYTLPDCEVLLVGHHGSAYSTSKQLLEAIRPEVAVISVGDNSYGHPTEETMERLKDAGAEIHRTDLEGAIHIRVTGGEGYGIE